MDTTFQLIFKLVIPAFLAFWFLLQLPNSAWVGTSKGRRAFVIVAGIIFALVAVFIFVLYGTKMGMIWRGLNPD